MSETQQETAQHHVTHGTVWENRPEWWRYVLCVYYFAFSYICARSLFPLPDEPNRMKFWPLFLTVTAAVFALQVLVSRRRMFIVFNIIFLAIAWFRIEDRIRFLEMMIEPFYLETYLRYSLPIAALVLLNPWVFRSFNRKLSEGGPKPPLVFKKGIPY